MLFFFGLFLAILVGVSLGLVGSGGSILTVPILVSVFVVKPEISFVYSLFIVGSTAIIGTIKSAAKGNVNFKIGLLFGLPSIVSVYLTRAYLVPVLPKVLFTIGRIEFTKDIYLMLLFSLVMIVASVSMIKNKSSKQQESTSKLLQFKVPVFIFEGIVVGLLSGLVGAGGGFLIIPALVLLTNQPISKAVGTSLFIISLNCIVGFIGGVKAGVEIDWKLLIPITLSSIVGVFIGQIIGSKIDGAKLKKGFGWFVLVMGVYVVFTTLSK
jgi:uncharacterized membrane protein YfcA